MRRTFAFLLVFLLAAMLVPVSALAGVEPSPFQPPGQVQELWTPPGQIVGLDPQPSPAPFSVAGQIRGFDPQPEPPGKVRDLWTAPGRLADFDRQPGPPGYAPIMQIQIVLF